MAQESQAQEENEQYQQYEYPEYPHESEHYEDFDADAFAGDRVAKTECPEGHFLYEGECYSEEDYANPKFMKNKVKKNTHLYDHINDFANKNDINIEDE